MTAHQGIDADDQHGPHHFRGERLADADRMRDDEVALQFLQQAFVLRLGAGHAGAQAMGAEQLVRIAAKPGGNAVDRLLAADLLDQEIGGALDLLKLGRIELDGGAIGDRGDLFAGQGAAIQVD